MPPGEEREELFMALPDILIIGGAAGVVLTLILIPICVSVLRRRARKLTEKIAKEYEL